MSAKTVQVEVWVVIDENGDYDIGPDAETATENYGNNVGDLTSVNGFRTVKVTLTVPLPVVTELTGTVPDFGTPGELAVA